MGSPASGLVRLVRAAVVAAVVLALSAGAHGIGGGALPSVGILGLLALPVALASLLLTRRRLSAPALTAVLGGAQLVLHHVFMVLAPMMSMSSGGPGWPMVVAHAVATVLLVAVVADGERALWDLWAWLVPLVTLRHPRSVLLPARRLTLRDARDVRPHDVVLLGAVPRRGPPVVLPG